VQDREEIMVEMKPKDLVESVGLMSASELGELGELIAERFGLGGLGLTGVREPRVPAPTVLAGGQRHE
jgi:hypothetical protein